MGSAFTQPLDIWNRACDHCGVTRIAAIGEDTKQYQLASTIYDKVRQSELRRNLWTHAIRRAILRPVDVGTALLTPTDWSIITTYAAGALVADTNGEWWQAKIANVGVTPAVGATWQVYYGQDCAQLYDYTGDTTYFAGEIVLVPATWVIGTTYALGAVVRYATDGLSYISLQSSNTGHTPSTATTYWMEYQDWLATSTLAVVPPSFPIGHLFYLSITSNNVQDPSDAAGQWIALATHVATNLQIFYPIGTGPSSDTQTANVYRKPRGWLRRAPENPKAGIHQFLGGPSALPLRDDLFEGDYFVAPSSIGNVARMVRYVADVSYVPEMDPMFCEGLGASLALQMNYPVNQSDAREATIAKEYAKTMIEARGVNAIEAGPEFAAEDPWITCRN